MADNSIDNLTIEIDASANKAKAGLNQVKSQLNSMKDSTKNINIGNLEKVASAVASIGEAGEGAKNAGVGLKKLASSMESLNKMSPESLTNISNAIEKISRSLGNLGNNNKISIKIDSEGVKKAVKPIEDMAKSPAMQNAQESAANVGRAVERMGESAQQASDSINSLIMNEQADADAANAAIEAHDKYEKSLKSQKDASDNYKSSIDWDKVKINDWQEKAKENRISDEEIAKGATLRNDVLPVDTQRIDQASASTDRLSSSLQRESQAANQANSAINNFSNGTSRGASIADRFRGAVARISESISNVRTRFSGGFNTEAFNEHMQEVIDRMQECKATMSGMENGTIELDFDKYSDAAQSLDALQSEFEQFKEKAQNAPGTIKGVASAFENVGKAAQSMGLEGVGSILSSIASLLPSIQMGGMSASTGFDAMAVSLNGVQAAIPIIGIILAVITEIYTAVKKVTAAIKATIQNVVNTIKSAITKIREAIGTIKSWLGGFFDNIKEKLGISGDLLENVKKKLRSFARLAIFMLLRKAFTALFSNIGNSFNLLAQYSDMMGTRFNKNVSLIVSDAKWLSNSVVAAFEPMINAITPILDAIITKVVEVINVINQFFSALTGGKTWTRAKRNIENYAGGLDTATGSAKDMKKAVDDLTTGIDELNILRQDDGSDAGGGGGGAGGAGAGDYYTTEDVPSEIQNFVDKVKESWEKADFTEVGKMIGDKLAESLANIPWDRIKDTASRLGKSLATLLNGFIQGSFDGKSVSWWIGKTIAEAINTAFIFIRDYVGTLDWTAHGVALTDGIKGALSNLDWGAIKASCIFIGDGIAKYLNAVFADIGMWELMGTTFSNGINSVVRGAYQFVTTFNWGNFGTAIGTFLGNAIGGIDYNMIAQTFVRGLNGAFEALHNFAMSYPWIEIGTKCANGINTALKGINWGTVQDGFMAFCKGIGQNINAFLTTIDYEEILHSIMMGIDTAFKGIDAFMSAIHPEEIAQKIVNGINRAVQDFSEHAAEWGEAAGKIIHALCVGIETVITQTNWLEVMRGISKFMAEIDWYELLRTVFLVFASQWTFDKMFKGAALGGIGKAIIEGIGKGISDAWDIFWNNVKGLWDSFITNIKNLLGIHSPSTVFAEIGGNVVAGIGQGISNAWNGMTSTLSGLWDSLVSGISSTWESIKTNTSEAWNSVKEGVSEKFNATREFLSNTATTIHDNINQRWTEIKDATNQAWEKVKTDVSEKIDNAKETATKVTDALKTNVSERWNGIKEATTQTWEKVKTDVSDRITNAKETASTVADTLKTNVSTTWDNLKSNTATAYQNLKDDVETKFNNMRSNVEGTSGGLQSTIGTKWEEMKNAAGTAWEQLKGNVEGAFNPMANNVNNTAGGIQSNLAGQWSAVLNNANAQWGWVKNSVEDKMSQMRTNLQNQDFGSVGNNVMDGIRNGISQKWDELKTKVSDVARGMLDTIKNVLGIHSPSRAFAEIGEFSVEGLIEGLETYEDAKPVITDFATDIMNWFGDSSFGSINKDRFMNFAVEIVSGFREKIVNIYRTVQTPIIVWATSIKSWFHDSSFGGINRITWVNYAREIVYAFRDAITKEHMVTKQPMITWATNVKNWFSNPDGTTLRDSFYWIGRNIIQGFIDGINSLWYVAMQRIREFGQSVVAEGRAATQEASPSKAFRQIGAYVVEGFNLGIEDEMQSTVDTMREWLGNINDNLVIAPSIQVDTSNLRNYTANTGIGFEDSTIIHNARQEYAVSGSVKTEVGYDFSNQMKTIITTELQPYLSDIRDDTRRQADKKESVNVTIGRKTIREAVVEQKAADGFNFTPQFS